MQLAYPAMTTPVLPQDDRFVDLSPAAGTTALDYDFEIKGEAGLTVLRTRAGVKATLVNGTDYDFLSGLGDTTGGTITLLAASLASDRYQLIGLEPIERATDLSDSHAFRAARYNEDGDKLTIHDQEQRRDIDRAMKSDYGQIGLTIDTAVVTTGKVLMRGEADDVVPGPSAEQIASAQGYAVAAGGAQDGAVTARAGAEEAKNVAIAAKEAAEAAVTGLERLPVQPESYGALYNGTDDKTAIETAATFAVANNRPLIFSPGRTYSYSTLSIPANTVIQAKGAVLRDLGTSTGSTVPLAFGNGVIADSIKVTSPGTETNTDIVSFGVGFRAEYFHVEADAQRAGGGVTCTGQDIRIGTFKSKNIDRPLHFFNQATGANAETTGSYIGYMEVEGYIRAFRADYCYGFKIGRVFARVRSANAVENTPGQNTVLVQGCSDFRIGDIDADDASEHVFRVGGSPHANCRSDGWSVGFITARRSGGCVMKINPTRLASAGVTEKARNWHIAGIVGIDCGRGSLAGNQELVRITHARNGYIGSAFAYVDQETVSAQYVVQANDCDDIEIGEIGGNAINAGFLFFLGTSDVDGVNFFGGDITDFRVGRLTGVCAGSNAIGVSMTGFNLANVVIADMDITGFSTNVLIWSGGTLTGPFKLKGRVNGATAPAFSSPPASDNFLVEIEHNNRVYIGRGASLRFATGSMQVTQAAFSSGNVVPAGYLANAVQATAGAGNFGGSYEFTRVGSSRRGAAIAVRQFGSNAFDTSLVFLTGGNTTATDALFELMEIKPSGVLKIAALPIYADNAAAVSGGLVAGDCYKTATGEVRIRV